jgi:hypothetical protein
MGMKEIIMLDIESVFAKLTMAALDGAKLPHGISNPILRMEEGRLFIASFIYIYNRDNYQTNQMPRPSYWLLADIETGDVVKEYSCRENDFSTAGFDVLYDLNDLAVIRPSREDFVEIYELFDSIRSEYIRHGTYNAEQYKRYLDRILEVTPNSYRRFYQELSNL